MDYTTSLIGKIDPSKEGLPDLQITEEHIRNPISLQEDYGLIGKGLEIIISNDSVRRILSKQELFIVSAESVEGLEKLTQEEMHFVSHLLRLQHERSSRTYKLATNEDFTDYDNVTKGVIKGIILGSVIGGILNCAQYFCDLTNIGKYSAQYFNGKINDMSKIFADMIARAGPALAESVSIDHEVNTKIKSQTGEEIRDETKEKQKNLLLKSLREIPEDSVQLAKASVDRSLWYETINILGILDKIRGRYEDKEQIKTNTKRWAYAQRTAPGRGLLSYGGLKVIREYFKGSISDDPNLKFGYDLLEAFAVVWINTGNNIQGSFDVYKNCVNDAKLKNSPSPKLDGFLDFIADPFQFSNLIVSSTWLFTESILRSYGIRAEDSLGSLGAGLESAFLSCDTAVAGILAKPIAKAQILIPARYTTSKYYLSNLALKCSLDL